MNSRVFIISFLLIQLAIVFSGFSEPRVNADSLELCLKTAKNDTNRAKILAQLSAFYNDKYPAKSLEYANECLSLATKLGFDKGIILAYGNIAGYYYYRNDMKFAEEFTLKELPFITRTHDKVSLSNLYANLSLFAAAHADFIKAFAFSDTAIKIAEGLNDSSLMAKILGNRTSIYIHVSDYSSAIKCLLQALTLNEKRDDTPGMAHNYSSLAYIYRAENNNPGEALSCCKTGLKLAEKSNDVLQQAYLLHQIGEIYLDKKVLDTARSYLQMSLNKNLLISNLSELVSCYVDIASVLNDEGKTDSALYFNSKAVLISKQINMRTSICYNTEGLIYMKKEDYKSAISFLLQGLANAKELGQKNNEILATYNLAKSYEALHDYEKSNNYWQQYALLNDSLLNEKAVRQTSEMEAKYNLVNKEKQISLLTDQENYQKQRFSLLKKTFIGGLLLVMLLFFLAYHNYRTRQLLKLQTLRTKIASDLHDDIGSTLSSISMFSLIARQQSKEVIPMLDQIGEHSRKMLESMADIVWTINPENDNFEKIILRMRSFAFEMLGAKNIDFDFNADESVSNIKLSMIAKKNLYLIFKEATNNMVKYAEANSAFFSVTRTNNSLTMLIRDNGKGFDMTSKSQGNGLKNMRNRAMEMGAKFLIESEPGKGTTIQLFIKAA